MPGTLLADATTLHGLCVELEEYRKKNLEQNVANVLNSIDKVKFVALDAGIGGDTGREFITMNAGNAAGAGEEFITINSGTGGCSSGTGGSMTIKEGNKENMSSKELVLTREFVRAVWQAAQCMHDSAQEIDSLEDSKKANSVGNILRHKAEQHRQQSALLFDWVSRNRNEVGLDEDEVRG